MADDPRPNPRPDQRPDQRIDLGLTGEGKPVVLLGEFGDQAGSMAELVRLAPDGASPARAADLALAANHFAHGSEYRVVTDPQAFEEAYRARLAREDASAAWQEGIVRLSDFGVPDFGTIHAPRLQGARLVFFAADTFLGVPYRVEAPTLLQAPEYAPLPLTPVPGVPVPGVPVPGAPAPPGPPEPEITPLTPEERDRRRTIMPEDLPAPQ